MRCELITSDALDDWYTIERLEHDHKIWLEAIPGGAALMSSARPSDSCIEGTSGEMLTLAYSIKKGNDTSFKRCSARAYGGGYKLFSPRNCQPGGEAILTLEEAVELADDIIAKLKAVGIEAQPLLGCADKSLEDPEFRAAVDAEIEADQAQLLLEDSEPEETLSDGSLESDHE